MKDQLNVGCRVLNTVSGKIGVFLRINDSGSIQVLEKIEPYVINTHDSMKTLKLIDFDCDICDNYELNEVEMDGNWLSDSNCLCGGNPNICTGNKSKCTIEEVNKYE